MLKQACYLSYYGSVGSASAYQSVDSGFKSRPRLIVFDEAVNIAVFSGRLAHKFIIVVFKEIFLQLRLI